MSDYNQSDRISPESSSGLKVALGRKILPWRMAALVLLVCMLLYDYLLQPALEPCGWLDIALRRSGCFQVLEMHEVLDGRGYSVDFVLSENGTAMASSSLLYGSNGKKGGSQLRTSVELWKTSGGSFTPLLEWTTDYVHSMALSPDGRMVALATWNGIILWEIPPQQGWSSEMLAPVEAADIAFSSDGALLASHNGTQVQLWQVSDHTLLQTLHTEAEGHRSDMAFSPDGTTLALGNNDGVILWLLTDRTPIRVLPGGNGPLAYSRDGTILVAAGINGLYLWRVGIGLSAKDGGASEYDNQHTLSRNGQRLPPASGAEIVVACGRWGLLRIWGDRGRCIAFLSMRFCCQMEAVRWRFIDCQAMKWILSCYATQKSLPDLRFRTHCIPASSL